MRKFHMFEIYASEEGVYFSSTDEKAQEMATKMFLEYQHNDSPPDCKISPLAEESEGVCFSTKIKT